MRGDSYQLQGQQGGILLKAGGTDQSPAAGRYRWLQVVTDAVLSVAEGNIDNMDTDLIGITLPAGTGIGGIITALTVTSGCVILYRA